MTLQPRPHDPIAKRKHDVRVYSKRAVISAAGFGGAGVLALIFTQSVSLFIVLLICAVAGAYVNWRKVQQIVNHQDKY